MATLETNLLKLMLWLSGRALGELQQDLQDTQTRYVQIVLSSRLRLSS